jgi:MFS family permease
MKGWYKFLINNRSMLSFGFFLNFFSGYGQTFLISLYLPFLVAAASIQNSAFGSLYSAATLISALLLSQIGKYIDTVPLKTYSWLATIGLIISSLLFSQVNSVYLLFAALLGLRLSGQGLMSHISSTVTAKFFDADRGKALGITSLGHPAGQFLLPVIIVPLIAFWGWRQSMVVSAALALVVLPWLIYSASKVALRSRDLEAVTSGQTIVRQSALLRERRFWLIAVNSFVTPFLLTALFLYQVSIGESKGWSLSWVAFSFSFYAISGAVSMLVAGWFIDRFSARLLFPLYLLPMLIGLVPMIVTDSLWAGPFYMAAAGISSGLGSPVKTALQSEIYGVRYLGTVRSLFSSLLVVSTALGPPLFGFLIDSGIKSSWLFLLSFVVLLLVILWSFRIWPEGYFQIVKVRIGLMITRIFRQG